MPLRHGGRVRIRLYCYWSWQKILIGSISIYNCEHTKINYLAAKPQYVPQCLLFSPKRRVSGKTCLQFEVAYWIYWSTLVGNAVQLATKSRRQKSDSDLWYQLLHLYHGPKWEVADSALIQSTAATPSKLPGSVCSEELSLLFLSGIGNDWVRVIG